MGYYGSTETQHILILAVGQPPVRFLSHTRVPYDHVFLRLCTFRSSCTRRHVVSIREALAHYELALAIDADFTLAEFNSGLTYQVMTEATRNRVR